MDVKDIARVCHEANAALCVVLNDFSQPSWEGAPEWQVESVIAGVTFALANPFATPSTQHHEWMKCKINEGWIYGPNKDTELKTHPCLVPYIDLPKEQQAKDALFRGIVAALKPLLSRS